MKLGTLSHFKEWTAERYAHLTSFSIDIDGPLLEIVEIGRCCKKRPHAVEFSVFEPWGGGVCMVWNDGVTDISKGFWRLLNEYHKEFGYYPQSILEKIPKPRSKNHGLWSDYDKPSKRRGPYTNE